MGFGLAIIISSCLAFASPTPEPEATTPVVTTRKSERLLPLRIEPWFAASSKLMFRTLTLEQAGDIERNRELLWKPAGLWLGAQGYYQDGHSWATGGLRGDLALGVELLTRTGSLADGLRHTTGYEWRVRPGLDVFLGGRVTFAIDPANLDQSHLELGAPVGLSWRRVELQWVPAVSFPLAQDRRAVFDGELRRRISLNFMPINVVLAFKLGRHRRKPDGNHYAHARVCDGWFERTADDQRGGTRLFLGPRVPPYRPS